MVFQRLFPIVVLLIVLLASANGQTGERSRLSAPVTYVTSATVYVGGGSKMGFQSGDTLTLTHTSNVIGRAVIYAVSSNSSAATVITMNTAVAVGDSVVIMKNVQRVLEENASALNTAVSGVAGRRKIEPSDNYVTGRVAIQYAGAGELVKKMDYSQPSMLLRLNVARLFGTGMVFTAYGRTSYDLSTQFSLYGNGQRASTRIYEMSLVYDDIQAPVGFAFGRILSRYLGGLGLFDGAQFLVRSGSITAGIAGGGMPDPAHSSVDLAHQKGIAFANYAWGGDVFTRSDVTLAYGQQLFHGKLDRDFLYTQTFIRPIESVSFYESSEFDLHDIQDGSRISKPHISSGFATLTYTPVQWLSFNTGVDASRPIYLFETMKNVPDSLFSKQVQEGIRGGVSIRLPLRILLMSNASFRPTPGQKGRTITNTLRMGNIAESGVDGGLQFTTTTGVYTTGTDFAIDFARWISQLVTITARLDRYVYTITSNSQRYFATTASLSGNVMISSSLYVLANYDQVWDSLRNTQRIYFEFGIRF